MFAKTNSCTILGRIFFLLLIFAGACGRDLSTAQGVVEEFVDHHYVAIDLAKAKTLAVSFALSKVNEEIRLTAGQTIDASTQKPRVNYRLWRRRKAPNGLRISTRARFSPMMARRLSGSG